jgi:predicted metal-dependent hydrolase
MNMTEKQKMNEICEKHNNCTLINFAPVGVVHFAFSKRAKHLSITVRHDSSIRVAIPKGVTISIARKFLESKIKWIDRHLKKIQQQNQRVRPFTELSEGEKGEARKYLIKRLNYLSNKYGFPYNRVFIRNQRTRWGSCSSKDNISLNMKIIRLPQELQDYIILHELVHIKHKNHSKKFWQAMDKLVGDSKQLKKRMRQYRLK